jgi:hypothetical protein
MRARVLALGLAVAFAAGPAGADTENLTGKWEGTMKCTFASAGSGTSKAKVPLVLNVNEEMGNVAIDGEDLGLFIEGFVVDEPAKDGLGTVSAVGCGFSSGNQNGNGVLRAAVKTKAGELKASLKGTAILINGEGPAAGSSICTFTVKRTNMTPDPLDPCA